MRCKECGWHSFPQKDRGNIHAIETWNAGRVIEDSDINEYLYIPVVRGVYRHSTLGVFQCRTKALEVGRSWINSEHDHYHDIEIIKTLEGSYFENDEDKIICTLSFCTGSIECTVNPKYVAQREPFGVSISEMTKSFVEDNHGEPSKCPK